MWPASASVTWTPWATSCSMPYGIGLEHRQREVDVVLGVQRVAEVQHHLGPCRRAAAPRGPARPGSRPPRRRAGASSLVLRRVAARRRAAARSGIALGRGAPSRLANSSWSLAESSSTSRASSAVAAVHTMGRGTPRATSSGSRPQWSRWAWVRTTASSVAGSKPSGTRLRIGLVGAALEHAAVDEDLGPAGVDEVARPGDGPRAAEEGELHGADRDTSPIPREPAWHDAAHARPRAPRASSRPRTSRRATRATGSTSLGPAASRPTRRRSRPRRGGGRGGGPRAARGHRRGARTADLLGRGRARPRAMRAGIETAFGADAELPVAPGVERPRATTRRRGPRPSRPAARRSRERLEGCYGTLRGRPRGRRRRLAAPAGPRPAGDGARRRDAAATPVPRASSRCGGRSTATASRPGVAVPASLDRRAPSSAGWAAAAPRSPPTSGRSGSTTGDIERWATTALEALARRASSSPAASPRRAADRAVGLVVAGRARRDRARRRRAPARRALDVNRGVPRVARRGPRGAGHRRSTRRRARAGRPSPSRSRRSGRGRTAAPTAPGDPGRPTVARDLRRRRPRRAGGARPRDAGTPCHIAAHPDATRVRRLARLGRAHRGARASSSALDVAEPAWQRRWLPGRRRVAGRDRAPLPLRRGRARRRVGPVRDPAPRRRRTAPERRLDRDHLDWLGIAPHPEWSWWAMRGQLVQEPGYMANYAVGAVLAADLRAAIRAARGDWTRRRPGLVRVGLASTSTGSGRSAPRGDVLRDVLGRPPDARALRRRDRPGPRLTSR